MNEIKYIQEGNSKNCLFLIHGFCSGSEDWDAQINFFKNQFTVISPTLRGHDGKNNFERPMSIEQLSNDCVSILNKNNFEKVILIGHSMGTRIAIDIANKINNAKGIILIDGSRFSDIDLYGNTIKEFETSILNNSYITVLEEMFSSMFFSKKFENDKKRIIQRAINIPEKYSLPLRWNAIWYDSHCVDNNLKNLNIPILILHSTNLNSKTGRVPIKKNEAIPYIDFICSLSKKVNVEKFENTGHYITIEEPDKTNKIILKWLDDINLNS
jgi:non-heme chloroperoxidase